jgi:hypothetical protein
MTDVLTTSQSAYYDCSPHIQAKTNAFSYIDIDGNKLSGDIGTASYAIYVKTIIYC